MARAVFLQRTDHLLANFMTDGAGYKHFEKSSRSTPALFRLLDQGERILQHSERLLVPIIPGLHTPRRIVSEDFI